MVSSFKSAIGMTGEGFGIREKVLFANIVSGA